MKCDVEEQLEIPELIVHQPIDRPRKGFIGEEVYAERWQELMEAPPEGWYSRDDGPAITAQLESVLRPYFYQPVGQRECSVAATFVCWLGTNVGQSVIHHAERLRKDAKGKCMLLAWTLHNTRSADGWRPIEGILAPRSYWGPMMGSGIGLLETLRRIPELTLTDYEVVERVACWLGGDGHGFVVGCEAEISRRQRHQSMLEWERSRGIAASRRNTAA